MRLRQILKTRKKKRKLPRHYQDYPKPEETNWWKQRASMIDPNAGPGQPPKFKNAEVLWQACQEYFNWIDTNPLQEAKLVTYMGEAKVTYLPKRRPYTLIGLCIFLNIDETTWKNYREKEKYFRVCNTVEKAIYYQKFEGAVADFFNANIIARDLGLKDSTEVSGPNGGPITTSQTIDTKNMSKDELKVLAKAIDRAKADAAKEETKRN